MGSRSDVNRRGGGGERKGEGLYTRVVREDAGIQEARPPFDTGGKKRRRRGYRSKENYTMKSRDGWTRLNEVKRYERSGERRDVEECFVEFIECIMNSVPIERPPICAFSNGKKKWRFFLIP